MMVTVLTILGMTLLGVSASQAARTMWQEKKEQAFYIAKSGADAVATYIIDNYNPATLTSTAITNLNNDYLKQDISLGNNTQGTFRAEVSKIDPPTPNIANMPIQIIIKSTATVGKVTNQVSITLNPDAPVVNMEHAILVRDDIKITPDNNPNSNTNVNGGKVAAGGNIINSNLIINANKQSNYAGPFPTSLPFPNGASWGPPLSVGSEINKSGYYGDYSLSSMFAINVPDNKEMHVVFNNFTASGTVINIGGSGKGIIHIYADKILGNGSLSIYNLYSAHKVILHVKQSIELKGSFLLHGVLLYAPDAEYTTATGAINLTGAMVTKNLTLLGSNDIHYDSQIANLITETRKFVRVKWSGQ
ncbi:DUF7305 domain-containing protein [Paenibacillus pini]